MNKKAELLFGELGKWVAIVIALAAILYFISTMSLSLSDTLEVLFG